MKLSELKKGTEITIRCKQKELLADIKAHIAEIRGEIVLLELVRHEGQVVDFSSPTVELIVIYEDGKDMPKAWTSCRIQRKTIEGKQYHVLAAPHPSVRVNRRRVRRVTLDIPCRINLPANNRVVEGTVHDLSGVGVGIRIGEKIEAQDQRHVGIEFVNDEREPDEYDEDEEQPMIKLEARVVWSREIGGGEHYYGCRLTHAEEDLGYYMAAKMREENA